MLHHDLRSFLGYLQERGQLATIPLEVDPLYEIAAYIRKSSDAKGPAFLFENVRDSSIRVAGGIFCSPDKAVHTLKADDQSDATRRFMEGLENPIPPVMVDSGECQEVVIEGSEIDLTDLPIPTYSAQDPGAFVTVGVEIVKHPETGIRNAGIYRMQLYGPTQMGLASSPYSDFDAIRATAERRGERLEMAVAIGVDPVIQLATQARVPLGVDELAIAGGLHGSPVELVKCRTIDVEVPATTEIVLEGYFEPGERHDEGPFGEFSGYVGPGGSEPVFNCTAITTRKDPIYQAGLTGMPVTENHVMKWLPLEALLLKDLLRAYPDITGLHYAPEGGAEFLVIVSLQQRYINQAKNLILAALGSAAHPKVVVVVDHDVDIYDPAQVWWSILTRAQPADDMLIVPRAAGGQLDPSAPSKFGSSLLGIDATRPYGEEFPEVVRIPGIDDVPDWTAYLNEESTSASSG